MRPKVYLETTVISYLTSKPTRDLVVTAHQQITRDWWEMRSRFELYVSQIVISEGREGDPEAAAERLRVVEDLGLLELTQEARSIAQQLLAHGAVPETAVVDALHIGIAVANGADYLLTWNCTHIANAAMRHAIESVCRSMGYEPPVICTPEELMEE